MAIFGQKKRQPDLEDDRPPDEEINLQHPLPGLFQITLKEHLLADEEVLAVLFIPSEHILSKWIPGKALVLTNLHVIVMEEGESIIADTRWGVKTRFYAYHQLATIEMGYALLRGRFKITCGNSCESWEIGLHWYNLNDFRAAARIMRQRMASAEENRNRRESPRHKVHDEEE